MTGKAVVRAFCLCGRMQMAFYCFTICVRCGKSLQKNKADYIFVKKIILLSHSFRNIIGMKP